MAITCILFNSAPHHQPRISDSPCHNRRHLPQTLTKTPILAISFLSHSPTIRRDNRSRLEVKGRGRRRERGWVRKTEKKGRRRVAATERERVSEKGRRHNNRRGKLRRSREGWKTLTIGEHSGSVPYREMCVEWSSCLSCGAEILFPRVYRVINHSTDWFGGKTVVVRKSSVFPGSHTFCIMRSVCSWRLCCVQH